jgi:hypothetical protein
VTRFILSAAAFLSVGLMCGPLAVAQAPERLTDKDVKALIETVDQSRDRFEDRLDGKVKDSVVRGPSGEANVGRFLEDFQESVNRLKERFKPDYAASSEAAAVLRQGTSIANFMKQQPPGFRGASEWDHLASTLGRLAAAYATKFPLASVDAPVRRVSDGEAAAAAEQVEKQADEFKDAVNREQSLATPSKNTLKNAADGVKNGAKNLKSRLNDAKPSTAEARALFAAIRKLEDSSKTLGLSPASLTAIGAFRAPLATLNQAFGIVPVPGT